MTHDEDSLRRALTRVASAVIEAKQVLTNIDNLTGDGDLGISMEKAALCVLSELGKPLDDGISELLVRCAESIGTGAPSTMGTLISFAILEAAKIMRGKAFFSEVELLKVPANMINIIMLRGHAQLGDKTVLDALIPYHDALLEQYIQQRDMDLAARKAADMAQQAALRTKTYPARIGRAKWIAERFHNYPDGGAVLCAIVVSALVGERFEIDCP